MPRVNLVTIGTQGVDLRVNPLFVTNSRLRSAINLVFEEGVIRTRPGVIYESMGVSGKLKGIAEFRPAQGLSSQSFAADTHTFVFVVDNGVYRKSVGQPTCTVLEDAEFAKDATVFIFQAENYLIFQAPESPTYWFDGIEMTKSPGMVETDWYDSPAPFDEVGVNRPTSEHPPCGENPCVDDPNTCPVSVVVINQITGQPIPGVPLRITYNKNLAHEGTTNAQGRLTLRVVPRRYRVDIQHPPYQTITQQPLDLRTCEDQVVALTPIYVEGQCGENISLILSGEPVETPLTFGSATGEFILSADSDDVEIRAEIIFDGEVVADETFTGEETLTFTKPDYLPYTGTLRVRIVGEGPEAEPAPIAVFSLTCPFDPVAPDVGVECDGECAFTLSDPEVIAMPGETSPVSASFLVTNETACPITNWRPGFVDEESEAGFTLHGSYELFAIAGGSQYSMNNFILPPFSSVRVFIGLIGYSNTLLDYDFVLAANVCNGEALGTPPDPLNPAHWIIDTINLNG